VTTRSLAEVLSPEAVVGACVDDPERWITTIDEQAKAACLDCPRRWLCAREACEMPRAEGMWAGVAIVLTAVGQRALVAQKSGQCLRQSYPLPARTGRRT
jgi:WhiB family transcriptional regulator, redox-sensing transcriptional regulator